MDVQQIIELLAAALGGGGLMSLFIIPEKKVGARLDNAERLIAKYEPLMAKLESENEALKKEVERLNGVVLRQDAKIAELKTKMHTMELLNEEDKMLRCEKVGCKQRKPKMKKNTENLESTASETA